MCILGVQHTHANVQRLNSLVALEGVEGMPEVGDAVMHEKVRKGLLTKFTLQRRPDGQETVDRMALWDGQGSGQGDQRRPRP